MRYIISDIHGCYHEYMELPQKINFSDADKLYVLGDAIDRGPHPIKVLQDIMKRSNVTYILGNHDFVMYTIMKKLVIEITEENYESHLTQEDILDYNMWLQDGGQITAEQFSKLGLYEKVDIIDYLSEASVNEVLEHDDKKYILVHSGLE